VWAQWDDLTWIDLYEPSVPIVDSYTVQFDSAGQLVGGGGTGYPPTEPGAWYYYENTEWWNQWFYDHPYDPTRAKRVRVEFDVVAADGAADGFIELALNWSTDQWSLIGNPPGVPVRVPPLPPLTAAEEAAYIGRATLIATPVDPQASAHYILEYVIRDYNPEWVSIDVRGFNFTVQNGIIAHDCSQSLDLAFVITGAEGEPVGACCYVGISGTYTECIETTQANCETNLGGVYESDGTVCAGVEACCLPGGGCEDADALCCVNELGGTPQGAATFCTVPEACCLDDDSCVMVDPICCDDLGGTPQGPGTQCTQPEACCIPDPGLGQICLDIDPLCCDDLGGIAQGAGALCSPNTIACCLDDGSCYDVDELCCDEMGGTPSLWSNVCLGDSDTNGIDDACEPPPVGACCYALGLGDPTQCVVTTEAECNAIYAGTYEGDGTTCAGIEACCMPDDTCVDADALCCEVELGGMPQGAGSACSANTIACCIDESGVTTCKDVDPLCCDDLGGFISPYSPVCLGDGDSDGTDDACVEPPSTVKWEQLPNTELPGLHAHDWVDLSGSTRWITLADDWLCEGGEVTDLHWWGNYELDTADNEKRGSGINRFVLSIHLCTPGPSGWCVPQATPLWSQPAMFYQVAETDTGLVNNEGGTIYRYSYYLIDPFPQVAGTYYWLDVTAYANDPNDPAIWRWQESRRDVAPPLGHAPAAQRDTGGAWSSIIWPPAPPTYPNERYSDMAFVITSSGCPASDPPTVPVGEPGYNKVRYISFEPANPGVQTALRVTLTTMPPPYAGFSGQQMWVGEAVTKCENGGVSDPPCPAVPPLPRDFESANLQCAPNCMDYGSVGVLHVTDDEIIPGAVYDVQAINCDCDFGVEANYSAPLAISTTRWGDLVGNCTVIPCTPPDGVVNITTDVTAVLDKFKNLPGAVMKSRADLDPNLPEWLVNITDVTVCLDAFLGGTYPPAGWTGPGGCSSTGARVGSYSNSGCLGSRGQSSTEPCVEDDVVEFAAGPATLDVTHWNATYNCCQDDIAVSASLVGNDLTLTEEEIPPGGLCDCICCFNVEATVVDLAAGTYSVEYCWLDYEQGTRCHTDDVVIP
jgi:hypothetical protein